MTINDNGDDDDDDRDPDFLHFSGILQPDTMEELWKIVTSTEGKEAKDIGYCMGWARQRETQEFGACRHQKETIQHEGECSVEAYRLLV